MVSRYTHKSVTWVDVETPTKEEVRKLMAEFSIHPLVAEELLLPTVKPKVELYNDQFIYLILHFPAFRHTHGAGTDQEVDFIIGRNFIITTRYDTIDPLHKFSKIFEVNSILDRSDIGEHAGFVFFYMIKKLYKALEHELEYISDRLHATEEHIFKGMEKEMVIELSNISRELLAFKQAVALHREVLESFEIAARSFFGDDYAFHTRAILGEFHRINAGILAQLDWLVELRETNNSLLTTKQNEVMKILTIMAFVTFPLSLLASIFGMQTTYLPFVGHPNDFWIIIGVMGIAMFFFFLFFKYKKWL